MRLCVQGWRGINHSYAMVNQYQLLELSRRPGVTLFHEDRPFPGPRWNVTDNAAGFDNEGSAILNSIPKPDGPTDIAYRLQYPYAAYDGPQEKLFCFLTCEWDRLGDPRDFAPAVWGPAIAPRTHFITSSRWSKEGLIRSRLKPENIHVVTLGVDPDIFHPPTPAAREALRANLKIAPDRFVFLNLSAMTPNKGVDLLLRAFAEVRRKHNHAMLLLKDQRLLYGITAASVIEETRRAFPDAMANVPPESLGVMGGNLDLKTLALLYGAADAYVAPYRAEAFNLPGLEAAACGLPVALTQGGATDDYAHESFALPIASRLAGNGGPKYLEPDLESLIDVMLRLIERRTPHINAHAAVEHIRDHLTWRHSVDWLLEAFAA